MSDAFTGQLLAFGLGIFTNFVVWFVLFHMLVPKIKFSPMISRVKTAETTYDKTGLRYRFKIENTGRRNIVDVELTARLSFKGQKTGAWNTLYIPLNANGELAWRIPILYPAKRGVARRRPTMFLHVNSAPELTYWTAIPARVRKMARAKNVTLEDLLSLGSDARLRVQAYCYDSFSGSRKVFISHAYMLESIAVSPYQSNSLQIAVLDSIAPMSLDIEEEASSPPNNSLERTGDSAPEAKDGGEADP